jgi:hypothetical protein
LSTTGVDAAKQSVSLRAAPSGWACYFSDLRDAARMRGLRDRWIVPAVAITAAVYLAGLLLLPVSRLGSALPIADFLADWLAFMLIVAAIGYFSLAVQFMWRREERPVTAIVRWTADHRSMLVSTALGLGLVGLVSMGFSWVKSELDYAAPFWADRLWADMDRAIFGIDPYIPLRAALGSGLYFLDYVYSLWYPATVLSLTGVFLRRDARAIVAYFLLWGVLGLVLQSVGSSAGPIFWSRMGLGDRYDALLVGMPRGSRLASDYLWHAYSHGSNLVASGISAMPSLHVGMAAWIALAYRRTIGAPVALFYWVCVFVGSVAIGWHYFMDGFVGSLMALASFGLAHLYLQRSAGRTAVEASPALEGGQAA